MTQFVIPPSNYEVKMKDGTKYRPNNRGTIEVENKRHIEEIKGSTAKNNLDMIKEKTWTPKGTDKEVPGTRCTKCLFFAYSFSSRCPRCDEKFTNKTKKGKKI